MGAFFFGFDDHEVVLTTVSSLFFSSKVVFPSFQHGHTSYFNGSLKPSFIGNRFFKCLKRMLLPGLGHASPLQLNLDLQLKQAGKYIMTYSMFESILIVTSASFCFYFSFTLKHVCN
jgi:hypothetical protein